MWRKGRSPDLIPIEYVSDLELLRIVQLSQSIPVWLRARNPATDIRGRFKITRGVKCVYLYGIPEVVDFSYIMDKLQENSKNSIRIEGKFEDNSINMKE